MGRIKIAAVIPLRPDPEKTRLPAVLESCREFCDATLVLHDRMRTKLSIPVTEEVTVAGGGGWNCWCNRTTLMVRAAKYGCAWTCMIDDDESFGPTITYKRLHEIAESASGYTEVLFRVRTAWNETHYRTDGIFGQQIKSFLIVNPFMLPRFEFEWGPEHKLHKFPTIKGRKMKVDDWIIHFGMASPELRRKNVAKYKEADPQSKFAEYSYLLDERNIKLEPL